MSDFSSITAVAPVVARLDHRSSDQPSPQFVVPVRKSTAATSDVAPQPDLVNAPKPAAIVDSTRLSVSLDADTNTFIYKSVDSANGDVVWQWPSEQVLRVLQYLRSVEHLEEKSSKEHAVDKKV
jgi:hypothetical protein